MARLGFSDTQISWTIYLRNGDAADVAQVAGRTVRYLGGKIGYMLAFDNVQAELLELNGTNYDAAAADLIDEKYKEQLQPKRVKNTPAGILNSYNNVFNITINNIFNNESTQQAKTPQGQMKTFTNYCNDIENKQDPDAIHFPENYDFNQQNLGNWTLLFE